MQATTSASVTVTPPPAAQARRPNTGRARRAQTVYESRKGLARWVAALELLLSAIESAAWELRDACETFAENLTSGWDTTKESAADLQEKSKDLKTELGRLLDVAAVASSIVFAYRFQSIANAFLSRGKAEQKLSALHARSGEKLLRLAERQQGGFVKVGQMLSARNDLLPKEMTDVLSRLQDKVAPLSFETVQAILREAWGEERFAGVQLEEVPLGSASIGQVHKAMLPDGRVAAVKVIRPGIEKILRHDMANMRRIAEGLSAYLPEMEIGPILDEIETQLMREVDLVAEAAAMDRARGHLTGFKWVKVPHVYGEWSAANVLSTEFRLGVRIDKALQSREKEKAEDILFTLTEVYLLQILVWGFFQPDTHPGNFLVEDDDSLVLLDFGCARELNGDFRGLLVELLQTFLNGDDAKSAELLGRMGFRSRSGDLKPAVSMARKMMGGLVGGGAAAWDVEKLKDAIEEAADLVATDPIVELPAEIIMVGRALGTLGGLFFTHRPNFDAASLLLPILAEATA